MVPVQKGTSVLYSKWARKQVVHKETPPPSLGGCREALQDCTPGLHSRIIEFISEWKDCHQVSREVEKEVSKSLPALSPATNFLTHGMAQHPYWHISVFCSSPPQQYPLVAEWMETTSPSDYGSRFWFHSHFSDASWDQVFVKHSTAVLHHLNHRETKNKFAEWDSNLKAVGDSLLLWGYKQIPISQYITNFPIYGSTVT